MNEEVKNKVVDFFAKFPLQKYRKGEILVRAGDNPSGIFYLKSGLVKEYAISRKGEEVVVNIFKPGAFFPMSYAINQTPNHYFFEALDDLTLVRAPREKVVEFVKNEHDVLFDLLSRIYMGMDGLLMRMTYLMSGSAYERIIAELIIVAKRFGEKNNNSYDIKITEKDLASHIGMTRETVSRDLKLLKDNGMIVVTNKNIHLKDIGLLESELNN